MFQIFRYKFFDQFDTCNLAFIAKFLRNEQIPRIDRTIYIYIEGEISIVNLKEKATESSNERKD